MCLLRRIVLFFALACATLPPLPGAREPAGTLNGRVDENHYVSPTGAFRVVLPVSPRLGGMITDTENVVTFQDRYNTHQSIACFKLDPAQLRKNEDLGRKEYLIWFLANFVQADFEQRFPGARVESARFLPDTQGGALLAYNLLPGGSMFASRANAITRGAPPTAKRGNLLFLHDGHIFVLSIELAEKVILGTAHTMTTEEEDAALLQRLTSLLKKITFSDAPPVPADREKPPAPSPAAPQP